MQGRERGGPWASLQFSGLLLAGPTIRDLKEVVSTPPPAASSVPPGKVLLGFRLQGPSPGPGPGGCGVQSGWEEWGEEGEPFPDGYLWGPFPPRPWLQSERSHDTHVFVLNPCPRRVRSRGGSSGVGPQLGGKGKSHAGILKTVTLKYGVTTLELPGRASPPADQERSWREEACAPH